MISYCTSWVLTGLLVHVSAQIWRDPLVIPKPNLIITRNATGPMRVGEILELKCTGQSLRSTTTVSWRRVHGNIHVYLWTKGHSPSILRVNVTLDLHGAEFFCQAPYIEQDPETQRYTVYQIHSDRTRLEVKGGLDSAVMNLDFLLGTTPGRILLRSNPGGPHRAGDTVGYTCTVQDLQHGVLDVIMNKGNVAIQLHTGYQFLRSLTANLTAAEHGTEVYCIVITVEEETRTLYAVESNRIPIDVIP